MAKIEWCEGGKYASYMREIDRIQDEAAMIERFMPEIEELQAAADRLKGTLTKTQGILEGILELEKELAGGGKMKSACYVDKDSMPRCERYVPECDFCIRDDDGNCYYHSHLRLCLNCNAIAHALESESVYMRKLRGAVEDRKRAEWEVLVEEARCAEVEG